MKILAWDLESRPLEAYRWRMYDQSPVGLSQMIRPGGVISFAARWVGTPKSEIILRSMHHDGHEVMAKEAWNLIDQADALLSWNGKKFDTRKMNSEFAQYGWAKPSPVFEIDMYQDARREFLFESNKLEHVAQILLGKGKVQHEGFGLWLKCLAGEEKAWAKMMRYNAQDVHLLIELYYRLLPWLKLPNANLFRDPDTEEGCPKCGSADFIKNGFRYTNVSKFQRYECRACGAYPSSGQAIERVDIR